jgi:hypothetical protein
LPQRPLLTVAVVYILIRRRRPVRRGRIRHPGNPETLEERVKSG